MEQRKCFKCQTYYPPETRICVRCGINLLTGQALDSNVPAAGKEEEEPPAGVAGFLAETLPGVFRTGVLLPALGLMAVGVAVIFFSLYLIGILGMGSVMIGGAGLVIYAQALTWLIMGEMRILHTSMTEFRGKDWSTFVALIFGPMILGLTLARHKAVQEAEQETKPPPPIVVSTKITEAAINKDYVITGVGKPGDGGSGMVSDGKGNLYFVEPFSVHRLHVPSGVSSRIAGTGRQEGKPNDGGPATKATVNQASAVAADASGNVYFVDTNLIRRIDAKGIINVYAGGFKGSDGDGGPALKAKFTPPMKLAVNAKGDLYILEQDSYCLRKIDAATGIVELVAGASRYPGFAGDGGPAIDAKFRNPYDLALDAAGNIYIADTGNKRIRKIDAETGWIKTIAGNGAGVPSGESVGAPLGDGGSPLDATVGSPKSIAVDAKGNVFFLSDAPHRVRMIDKESGIIATVAGNGQDIVAGDGGPSWQATLSNPASLASGPGGTIYIGDDYGSRIRKLERAK